MKAQIIRLQKKLEKAEKKSVKMEVNSNAFAFPALSSG